MKTRLYVAAIFGGVAAMLTLAVVVVVAGRLDPSPPSLQGHPVPAIPGEILYVDEDNCIVRARASGEHRERIRCVAEGTGPVSWVNATTIAYWTWAPNAPTWTEIDIVTGAETVNNTAVGGRPQPDPISVKGERADIERNGDVYRSSGAERVRVFEFDGPEHRQPSLVTWSPDGEWLLLRYEDELWIVSRDGTIAGTLAKTRRWGSDASWWIDGHGYLPRVMQ